MTVDSRPHHTAGRERAREISRVLWIVLALNWLVALFKVALGHFTGSIAIFADGLHSFSDGASNVIGLVAMAIARHPADHDHPYGHEKYETLAATAISFLLFFVAYRIIMDAIGGLLHPRVPHITAASFVVMGFTLIVNVFVTLYERRKARKWKSELLESDSAHTLTDVFVTLSVLVALVGMKLGFPYLDALFAIGIAAVIVFTGLGILKTSSDILVDKAPIEPERIAEIARKVKGVRDCHEVRARGKPGQAYIDMHVLVADEMTVMESHRLANIIERDIRQSIKGVRDVVVHIEPVSHEHDEL